MKQFGVYLLILIFAFSCADKKDKQHPDVQSLGISANKVSVTNSELDNSGEWSAFVDIKNNNLVGFTSCLKDPLLMPLYSESIEIQTPLKKHMVQTDSNGCFQWNEFFEFNPLENEKFIEYNVIVTSARTGQVMIAIPLAINPWRNRDNLRDLRYDQLSSNEVKAQSDDIPQFIIADASFKQIKSAFASGNQTILPAHTEFKMILQKRDERGDLIQSEIKNGKVHVIEMIVENDQNIIAKSEKEISISGTKFIFEDNLKMQAALSGQSKLEVILMITLPMKGVAPIKVSIPLNGIEGGAVSVANEVPQTKVDQLEVVQPTIKEEDETQVSSQAMIVTSVSLAPGSIDSKQFNLSSQKTMQSRIQICLADSVSSTLAKPLAKFKFDLETEGAKINSSELTTRADGCAETILSFDYDSLSCEKFIKIPLVIKGKDNWLGHIQTRTIMVNPWNKSDFSYDVERQGEPQKMNCLPPQFHVEQIQYQNQGILRDQLKINRLLDLNYKRRFEFRMNPMVQTRLSNAEESAPRPLHYGKLKISAEIFVPTSDHTNYLSPNAEDLILLSRAETDATISVAGSTTFNLDFAFDIADAHFLANKNIVRLKIKSDDFPNINESAFIFQFVAETNAAPTVTALTDHINKGMDKLALKPVVDLKKSPLALYQEYLIESKKLDLVTYKTLKDFNDERPLNQAGWQLGSQMNKDRYYSELSLEELRMLSRENGRMPVATLSKLCRHFYAVPTIQRELRSLGGINYVADGGALFNQCIKDPNKMISILGMTFITKLLKDKAKFISDNNGRLNRGKGYFAGSGDRSGIDHTTSEGESWMIAMGGEFGLPDPFHFGMEGGYARTYAISDSKSVGDSQMAMVRYGSNQDDMNLNYESLTLEVVAETLECFTANAEKSKRTIQLCMPAPRLQKLQETWYFIEESISTQNGVIADGNRFGGDYMAQIVRGSENFNRLWDKFVRDDNAMIVQNLDQLDIKEAFRPLLNGREAEYLYSNSKDNAIPGVVIKTVRNPHSYTPGISSKGP